MDDSILFCDPNISNIWHLKVETVAFALPSDFETKINLQKSVLILIGGIPNLQILADTLGCKIGSLTSTYLDLHLEPALNML